MSGRKGSRGERQTVNELGPLRFAAMKAPASGAATTAHLPDVIAGSAYYGVWIAIEVKVKDADLCYLHEWEVAALEHYAHLTGAIPVIAMRWHGNTTIYVARTDDLEYDTGRTPAYRFRVRRDESTENWTELEDIHELIDNESD